MTVVTINPVHVRPLVGSIVRPATADETMVVGDLVYVSDGDDVLVKKTDADTLATVTGRIYQVVAGGRHMTNGAIIQGEAVTILEWGRVSWGPDVDLDVTAQYFVSNTAGKVDTAAGTNTRRIGSPETVEVFFFNPEAVAAPS
jgi:hypothetical protein